MSVLNIPDGSHLPPAERIQLAARIREHSDRILASALHELTQEMLALRAEGWITVQEAARRLNVNPQWLRNRKNRLPFFRQIDGVVRVDADAFEKWRKELGDG